ncbi:MAG TPA: hypothetical protein VN174_03795 [Candidatus Methanoperedens sp.]|nr:hypothetical protein [Candidatus Methanoperedens sp.]
MKENINKSQSNPVEKRKTMDIYNFDQTFTIPPAPEEPLRRDGYKWVEKENRWTVDISQSQTKRFEIMLKKDPNSSVRSVLAKERQLDGYEQILRTPPEPGGDTTIWPNGYKRVWNPENGMWDCFSDRITDPPKEGDANIRRNYYYTNENDENGKFIEKMDEYKWLVNQDKWVKTTYLRLTFEILPSPQKISE